jgi:hypothetical protein
MSLGIVIKGPEGLVLAAESRVTLIAASPEGPLSVNFDNATKLLTFGDPYTNIGVVTYGQAAIGLRTAHSFVPEFEAELKSQILTVNKFSEKLSEFFSRQWAAVVPADFKGPNMSFVVAGFDEGEAYGKVYLLEIPVSPAPIEQSAKPGEFGMTWGGQGDFVHRLVYGFDKRMIDPLTKGLNLTPEQIKKMEEILSPFLMPMPLQAMPLQDCVDLAIFFIRTTIDAQRLSVGIRGCGGPIDVAVITRSKGLSFVQRKQIVGEYGESVDIIRP